MENINYFYKKDENGDVELVNGQPVLIDKPHTSNLSVLRTKIKNGEPQGIIDKYAQLVANAMNWSHYDTYISDYEKWQTECNRINEVNDNLLAGADGVLPDELGLLPEPTLAEFELATVETVMTMVSKTQWELNRKTGYGLLEDQLDEIYHNGLESWQARIQAVKDQFPKPE